MFSFEDIPLNAIGFTAFATEDRVCNIGDHIHFDGILSNIDTHYDVKMNYFVCPHDATYSFSASLMASVGERGWFYANIVRRLHGTEHEENEDNTLVLGTVYASDTSQGSISVVTECNMFDKIYVEMISPGTVKGDRKMRVSTFSGFPLL